MSRKMIYLDDAINAVKAGAFGAATLFGRTNEGMTALAETVRLINDMPPAQPEQRWIPCSERLPEHSERYLVSVLDGIDRRTTVAPYHPRSRTWSLTGRMAYWKVIAWMPLPECYRGEEK